jgi:hypothetical protein
MALAGRKHHRRHPRIAAPRVRLDVCAPACPCLRTVHTGLGAATPHDPLFSTTVWFSSP